MSSSILHQCPFCGHVSDISLSLAAFIEDPHCAQCGLSVSESNGKLQDELSALFDRQMTMEPPQHTPIQSQSQPQPVNPPPISYSITQHYHHSSHVAPPTQPAPTPSDRHQALHSLMTQHGIDPSTLSPAQLELISHADTEQQQRLIQTWQVYALHGQGQTTQSQDTQMDDLMDNTHDNDNQGAHAEPEPYMVSGYEAAAQATPLPREPSTGEPYAVSTDPVYKSQGQSWWEVAPAPGAGDLESQYGLFEERNRYSRMHGCAGVPQPPQWLCPN